MRQLKKKRNNKYLLLVHLGTKLLNTHTRLETVLRQHFHLSSWQNLQDLVTPSVGEHTGEIWVLSKKRESF